MIFDAEFSNTCKDGMLQFKMLNVGFFIMDSKIMKKQAFKILSVALL